MKPFTPQTWYWYVGGDHAKAYSSTVGDYVPAADAAFQAWLADGTLPTSIDSETSLGDVLSAYSLRPTAAGVLDGYTTAQAGNIVAEAIFKILFNHENRIRTIERALSLNGSPANLTQGQAKAAVKALM